MRRTLHLPTSRRRVQVDWAGACLIACAASELIVWVSFAGDRYAWRSWQTTMMLGATLVLVLLFLVVERRAEEPIIPLWLFRNRTVTLAVVPSLVIGVAMFGATVFLGQYFQLARGESPARAGVMTLPMVAGLAVASTVAGRLITRTGRWKVFLLLGGVLLTTGLGLLGLLRHDTPYWQVAAFIACAGLGLGLTMQNLVPSVQNQVRPADLGAAGSLVAFFRTLGGAVGVAAFGAVLSGRVARYTAEGLGGHAPPGNGEIPRLSALPPPVRTVVESAFGHGIGDVFGFAAPLAFVALLAIAFIKEVPLRTAEPPRTPDHGGLIRGAVRDQAGAPVAQAALTLIDTRGHQVGRTVTRADGRYALPVPAGREHARRPRRGRVRPTARTGEMIMPGRTLDTTAAQG